MEKTEAVSRLKKAGYQVQFDSSIVTILLPAAANRNQELKKLRAFLQEIGYDASFGIRQVKESHSEEEEISEGSQKPEEEELKEKAREESLNTESALQGESVQVEVGEQFSLEDFGLE